MVLRHTRPQNPQASRERGVGLRGTAPGGSDVGPVVQIEVWSDVVCPWCWIGKRHLEAALERFGRADEVEVVWRAFELDPSATSGTAGAERRPSYAQRLAAKYGTDVAGGQQMVDTMTERGAEVGLDMRFDRAVGANTADAHQLLHLAEQRGGPGLQGEVKERFMRAYFTEGEAVGDHDVLVRLASEAGLDADAAREVLASGSLLGAVRAEEAEAAALGATGVPFFVVDRRYGVAGAQPVDALLGVLERAWADRPRLVSVVPAGDGSSQAPACGPDGCAI